MTIKYTDNFLKLFEKNPNDLELNNHPLREPYQGLRSIDITADEGIYLLKSVSKIFSSKPRVVFTPFTPPPY